MEYWKYTLKAVSEMVWEQNVCYAFTTAQVISRFAHRGCVEVERVLRRLWEVNRRTPLCGERELVLVQSGHSTNGTPLSRNCWRSIGTIPEKVHLTALVDWGNTHLLFGFL